MVKKANGKDRKTFKELLKERLTHLTPLDPESARFQFYLEYDLRAVERGKDTANTLKRFLNLEGSNTLDLGCGTGGYAIAFSHEGALVIGLDPDKSACHLALIHSREMGMTVDFVVGDGSSSPLRDSNFQLVICNHVFEHVKNKEKLAHEISRLLKIGGVVYLTAPNKTSPWNIIWDDHTGLPFITLMPRKMQNILVKLVGLSEKGLPFVLDEPSYKSLVKTFKQVDMPLDDKILKKDIAAVVFSSRREILLSARSNRYPQIIDLLTRISKISGFAFAQIGLSNVWWMLLILTYPLLTFLGRKETVHKT